MVNRLIDLSNKIFDRRQENILSAATVIQSAMAMSVITGIIRERVLVAKFYSTSVAAFDAFFVAFRFPELAFQLLVVGAVSAAFIPVFSKYLAKDEEEANRIVNTVMNLVILIFIISSIVIFVFARQLNGLITGSEFTADQLDLATNFTRIMVVSQLFFAVSNFLTSMIQAHHRFVIPALSPSVYNLGIILGTLLLFDSIGIYAPAVGVIVGSFLHLIIQIPLAIKLGFGYRPTLDMNLPGVLEMIKLMPPRIAAISVTQLESFVMVFLTTTLPTGSLSIYNLSQRLMSFPVRVFSVPLSQASLPTLSKLVAKNKPKAFAQTLTTTLTQVLFLALPAATLIIVLRIPLVRLAFGAKAFPWEATLITGKVVAVFALGIATNALSQLLTRAFYAMHNTKIPLVAAIFSVLINLSLSYLFITSFSWGLVGIATASVVASVTQALILIVALAPNLDRKLQMSTLMDSMKIVAASAGMAIVLWSMMHALDRYVLDTTRTLNLVLLTLLATAVGGAVYMQLSRVFQIKELYSYLKIIKKLGNWQKVLHKTGETITPSDTI